RVGATVSGDERKVRVLKARDGGAGRILERAGDGVLREAEDDHRGAPFGRVTGAGSVCNRPGRPRNPSRRIELHLHERGPGSVFRLCQVDDVAIAGRCAGRYLIWTRLRIAQGHAKPESTVELEVVGLPGGLGILG